MKKFLVIALALMMALALVACSNNNGTEDGTGDGVINLNPNGTTNENGENPDGTTEEQTTEDLSTPSQEEFIEKEQTIFVVADVANIRSDTYVSESTFVGYASKDTEFKSVAYNSSWYKIEYVTTNENGEAETLTCYLHKSTACVKDTSEVVLEEPITIYVIAYALNVRSYYDFTVADNLMCTLKQYDEVTAVAKGDGWYKIQLSDDAEGNPVFGYISANEQYISTTKPEETTAEDTTAEDTTAAEQ